MEQLVRVQKLNDDGTAQVLHIRESACSGDCHQCSGCGAVQQKLLLTARNPIGATPGQIVIIRADSGPVLTGAAMLYILPLVLFFLGYLIFEMLWERGALGGGLAFVLAIGIVTLYDRLVAQKQRTTYTITGFAPNGSFPNKGDNNFD